MTETWLPVLNFEDFYEISNLGRVRSIRRGIILKPSYSNSGGYPMVVLCVNKKQYGRYLHRMALEAFDGPCPEGLEGRHLDGNASNPALYDINGERRLIWGTSSDNKFDEVRHGTHAESRKTHCKNGHEFTSENTRIWYNPDGSFRQRVCRTCNNRRYQEWLDRNRQ